MTDDYPAATGTAAMNRPDPEALQRTAANLAPRSCTLLLQVFDPTVCCTTPLRCSQLQPQQHQHSGSAIHTMGPPGPAAGLCAAQTQPQTLYAQQEVYLSVMVAAVAPGI
jgi:hypothetical protein